MKTIKTACGTEIKVDDDDFSRFSQMRWYLVKSGKACYAKTAIRRNVWRLMHSFLCATRDGEVVDHINGDGMDNQKANLRAATRSTNAANSGKRSAARKYKGVSKNGPGWQASIGFSGKLVYLGTYPTEELAAVAYDIYAVQCFGEFARLNTI